MGLEPGLSARSARACADRHRPIAISAKGASFCFDAGAFFRRRNGRRYSAVVLGKPSGCLLCRAGGVDDFFRTALPDGGRRLWKAM